MTYQAIVACDDCGQLNRLPVIVPPGKIAVCGACRTPFDVDVDDDVDDDAEEDD